MVQPYLAHGSVIPFHSTIEGNKSHLFLDSQIFYDDGFTIIPYIDKESNKLFLILSTLRSYSFKIVNWLDIEGRIG